MIVVVDDPSSASSSSKHYVADFVELERQSTTALPLPFNSEDILDVISLLLRLQLLHNIVTSRLPTAETFSLQTRIRELMECFWKEATTKNSEQVSWIEQVMAMTHLSSPNADTDELKGVAAVKFCDSFLKSIRHFPVYRRKEFYQYVVL